MRATETTRRAKLDRVAPRDGARMVPRPLGDGRFEVDAAWGSVQPLTLAPGVTTVGELELIEHIRQGLPVIDTRRAHFHRQATIPGARGIPHDEILDHCDELDPRVPTVFFCNGAQCKATPDAIRALLRSGYPAEAILYYRGGLRDWMTLGYRTVAGVASRG